MDATIKSFKEDRATGVKFSHAPSLFAAIRRDAEILAKVFMENHLYESTGTMCKYVMGNVDCDVTYVGTYWIVEFYKNNDTTPFATAHVK